MTGEMQKNVSLHWVVEFVSTPLRNGNSEANQMLVFVFMSFENPAFFLYCGSYLCICVICPNIYQVLDALL